MPKKIVIIGTLHSGITLTNELEDVIKNFKPDQLLVEIAESDINKNDLDLYPPEMIFALKWAKNNNVKVAGFDSKINIFHNGTSTKDNLLVIEKQKKLIKNLSWKEFNKVENEKLLDVDELSDLVDKKKEKEREREMLKNIEDIIIKDGTVVVVTGIAHLDFFERNIKDAIFPFRN